MQIDRSEASCRTRAPEGGFSGDVRISGYFQRARPSRLAGGTVTFAPGSRTPWKVNPFGQTLVVISGVGRVQCEGESMMEIHAGDVVWFSPGERHWEGATPESAMTCFAIQEEGENARVRFGERVTDEDYGRV